MAGRECLRGGHDLGIYHSLKKMNIILIILIASVLAFIFGWWMPKEADSNAQYAMRLYGLFITVCYVGIALCSSWWGGLVSVAGITLILVGLAFLT